MRIAIVTVNTIVHVLTLVIFVYTLLSFFLDRYHPIQKALGVVVDPMLKPIRKLVPAVGGFDFSPLILMILIQVIGSILVAVLRGIT